MGLINPNHSPHNTRKKEEKWHSTFSARALSFAHVFEDQSSIISQWVFSAQMYGPTAVLKKYVDKYITFKRVQV